MKCNNCGADLREEDRFCPVCGQETKSKESVQNQPNPVNMQEQMNVETAQNIEPSNSVKKKKSTGFKIGIAAVIVAVLAVGVAAGAKVAGGIRKMTMSPAKYYRYVEEKNRDAGGKLLLGSYDVMRKNMAGTSDAKNINMKMEISDTAKSLLSLTGMDFSKFENLELDLVTGREEEALSNQIKVKGNGNDLLTVKTYLDAKDEKMYYQIPELSKAYLDFSAYFELIKNPESALDEGHYEEDPDLGAEDDIDLEDDIESNNALNGLSGFGVNSMLFQPFDYEKMFMETETLKKLYERYTDILIKSAENVKKAEGTCEAEGISQKADKYTVTLNGREVAKLVKELLETLKKDAELKTYIENMNKDAYQEFTEDINDALENLDSEIGEEELQVIMDAFVSSDEKIIGRTFTVMGEKEKAMEISYAFPQEGEKFGFTLGVKAEGTEYVNVKGKGTLAKGVMNGDFTLSMSGILDVGGRSGDSVGNFLIVKIEDYDISKLDKGEAKGTFTYSTEAVAALANYSLKVESEANSEGSKGTVYIMAGKDALATVHVTMDNKAKAIHTKPSDGDTIYDVDNDEDMLKYQSEMDIMELLTGIQEKLGIDLSGLLTSGLGNPALSGSDDFAGDGSNILDSGYEGLF